MIRPGVRITGLGEFDEVFLIAGTLMDKTEGDEEDAGDTIFGPRKIPPTFVEVEVTQGRNAVITKVSFVGRGTLQYALLNKEEPRNFKNPFEVS